MDSAEKSALISELAKLPIKHTPEEIVKIAKQAGGKIVFLEQGNADGRTPTYFRKTFLRVRRSGNQAKSDTGCNHYSTNRR